MKYGWLLVLGLVFLAACTAAPEATSQANTPVDNAAPRESAPAVQVEQQEVSAPAWIDAPLLDVNTGQTIRISEIDEPVLVENFAVWCSSCLRAQQHMQAFREKHTGFTSIALNIDPTEDDEAVKAHASKHGFDWVYANADGAIVQEMIRLYGSGAVSAPLTPFILVCPNGHHELLTRGTKNDDVLLEAIERCGDHEIVETVPEKNSVEAEREVFTDSDGVGWLIPPGEVRSGGPPKDGIPSIDNPTYESVEIADKWIQGNELVLAISRNGVERAYPLQVLVWHEIVNDFIDGEPILITYCPLCGSGIAYERTLNGEAVEFGTTGRLYNSNLLMYDRATDSWWTQIDGLAVTGEHMGQMLTPVSIDTVVWRDWKEAHPDGEVLTRKTGHVRSYGTDPYGNYYEDSYLIFPVNNEDDRIHAKDVVFGINVNGVYKAYREDDLPSDGSIQDTVNGVTLTVTRDEVGVVTFFDGDGNEYVKERDFWFAWYAFHPDTQLYGFD